MRFFLCVLDPQDRGITAAVQRTYEAMPRSRGLALRWEVIGQAALLTGSDEQFRSPMVARDGDWVAIGTVRLDNRSDLVRWSGSHGDRASDLDLMVRAVARLGIKCISHTLGDFAFVAWHETTRTAVAACDVFAVKKLYYTETNGLFVFASRAEALSAGDRYEVQYLAERVAKCSPTPELTVYAGVRAVPAASVAVLEGGRLTTCRYWSPDDFEPDPAWSRVECEAAETCRSLLIDSVRLRLRDNMTWAQLSGGIDSSSIVSLAQWLAEQGLAAHGLAGTITYADRQSTASDERQYSDAVLSQWRVQNKSIVDPPFWYDDACALPRTDLPSLLLPFYPREHRLRAIVRAAGGRVLLTGIGGDELFTGTMLFFADWIVRGSILRAMQEMLDRAAIGRASFWDLAYRNALLPLLPPLVQRRLINEVGQMPAWVTGAMAKQYDLDRRAITPLTYAGPIGRKYQHAIVTALLTLASTLDYGTIPDELEVQHPFLYRPLVEFALRLSPELCARPNQRKWVLREAMRGILPDTVRTRIGKGSFGDLYAASLMTKRPLLEPLIHNSMLADLGIVDTKRLRAAFDTAPQQPYGKDQLHTTVHSTLVFEAWLQIRSGRWPRGGHRSSAVQADEVQ